MDDWVDFVESSCQEVVNFQTFDRLIREQLRLFTVRRMIYKMNQTAGEDEREATIDLALKHLCTVGSGPLDANAPGQAEASSGSEANWKTDRQDSTHGDGRRNDADSDPPQARVSPQGDQEKGGWKCIKVDCGCGLVMTVAVETQSSVADALVST